MSGYKLNRPVLGGVETKWYRMLRAIYKANQPLHKKEWFALAEIPFSDQAPKIGVFGGQMGIEDGLYEPYRSSKWPYRHWKGLYPDLFKELQRQHLIEYDPKIKKWKLNRFRYKLFCDHLNIER